MGPARQWKTTAAAELESLAERYGVPLEEFVGFPLASNSNGPAGFPLSSPRIAEVVLVVPRHSSRVLVHTKHFYPSGVWRLPTGGIRRGEKIEHAILRETTEETGNDLRPVSFLFHASYRWEGVEKEFHSYAFLMTEPSSSIESRDPREQITAFRDVDREGILRIAERLETLGGSWRQWGLFRAVAHRLLLRIWPESGRPGDPAPERGVPPG
jgi:ADP-ribose pyrophosphatase YjhB (NUDIX family)